MPRNGTLNVVVLEVGVQIFIGYLCLLDRKGCGFGPITRELIPSLEASSCDGMVQFVRMPWNRDIFAAFLYSLVGCSMEQDKCFDSLSV